MLKADDSLDVFGVHGIGGITGALLTGIFNSTVTMYNVWLTVFAGLCIILAAVYTLNMIRKVFYGNVSVAVANAKDIKFNEKFALGIIVILIFWLGIYSQPFLKITEQVSADITNGILLKKEIIQFIRK